MVLFTSLMLAKDLFVPITIVAYLYLSLTYGGYPFLVRLLVPKRLRGIKMDLKSISKISSGEKLTFAIITCVILCLLFPVAAPLFMSFFLGVIIKESGVARFVEFIEGPVLYGSTFFMGLLLGVLCEASTILNPKVLILLFLGSLALLISGIGGIIGGYVMYFLTKGKFNPVVGIAGTTIALAGVAAVRLVAPGLGCGGNAPGNNDLGICIGMARDHHSRLRLGGAVITSSPFLGRKNNRITK